MKLALAFFTIVAVAAAQDGVIDVERSTISIHVSKAGLLSAAGHDHWVTAPIAAGAIQESVCLSVVRAV